MKYKVLILLLLLLLPGTAGATDHYINAAVSGGSDTGADWTNAWGTLPETLVRGDTYWIADGQYGAYTFNDAVSGDTKIWIKKATVAAHGTETGWDNAYGDGQAVFTGAGTVWQVTTSNWVFDGQGTNTTADTTGQGIKILVTATNVKGAHIHGPSSWSANLPDTLVFKHIEIQGKGYGLGIGDKDADGLYVTPPADGNGPKNVTIQYCYLHDINRVHIHSSYCSDWIVEHTYFARNDADDPAVHAEAWADYGGDDMIVRYCTFADIAGTGVIALLGSDPTHDPHENWEVYGNLFFYTPGNPYNRGGVAKGVFCSSTDDPVYGLKFYNNTTVNIPGLNAGLVFDVASTDVEAYNNIWVNCNMLVGTSMTTVATHDYNYYSGCIDYRDGSNIDAGLVAEESNAQLGTVDVFADSANVDFTLAVQTDPGYTLASPYDVDRTGTAYSVSGGWSMGYDAYDSEGAPAAYQTWYVDRSLSEDGTGTYDDPWQSSQVAAGLGTGDTLYDITPTVTGANPYTVAADSAKVLFKTGAGATPTIVGGLKPLTMTNQSTFGSDSVLVAANNDDSFLAEGHAYGWRNYYTSNSIDVLFFGEINTDRRTNIFAAFNFPESVTSVTSATLRCFVHYNSGASVKYDIRGILSKNVTPPSDSLTFQAFYTDSLDAATAVGGTLSLAGGASLNYEIATITDLVNAVLGVDGNTGRVGLMMLTDISGGSNSMRIEAYEEGAGRPMAIYYEYGTESDYWAYAIPEAEQAISKVYRDGVLMTSVAFVDLDAANEYHITPALDSLYVYGSGDGITADAYGPITISGNHCTVYGGVFRHGNQAGGLKISGDGTLVANCLFDSSDVGIAVITGADGTIIRNNVFSCVAAAIDDDGTNTDEGYSAYVTGSDATGLTDPLEIASYSLASPPETLRDVGDIISGLSYLGTAPEIGPVELEALAVATWHWDNGAMSRYGQPRPVSRYGRVPAVSRR